jgi:hypothetical protein
MPFPPATFDPPLAHIAIRILVVSRPFALRMAPALAAASGSHSLSEIAAMLDVQAVVCIPFSVGLQQHDDVSSAASAA